MSIIHFLALLSVLVSAFYQPARAQQATQIPRIGYLSALDKGTESKRIGSIRLALREIGYIEGQNIRTEYRYADGNLKRVAPLAEELVRLPVDLIVTTGGDPVIRAAKNATRIIPIVMVGGGSEPVAAGFIESLARPGGNITGLTNLSIELAGKRLETLKEAAPTISTVAVFYGHSIVGNVVQLKEVKDLAPTLGLTVQAVEIRGGESDRAFSALSKHLPDSLYVPGGPVMNSHRKRIVGFALKHRLPSIYSRREFVDAGGLIYYGTDLAHSYRRVAYYVDRILKGAKPADLPVEQPTKFELIINLNTAKQIGLTIPPNVLARADRVIR